MPVCVSMAATPEEIPQMVKLQYEVNLADPVFASVHPSGSTTLALTHSTRQLEDLMDEDPTVHMMVVKEAMHGEIVPYALWHFISLRPTGSAKEEMPVNVGTATFSPDSNAALGVELMKASIQKRLDIVRACFGRVTSYAYLAAMGTSPQFQKQGAASKLVEWATEHADDRNIPLYVESTPVAVRLYRRFGFQEYDRLQLHLQPITDGSFTHPCMVRFPNAT